MPSLRLNYYLNKPAIFLECPIPIESFYIYIRAYLCRVIGQTVDELSSLTLPLAFSYFNLYFFIKSFLFPSSTSSLPFRFSPSFQLSSSIYLKLADFSHLLDTRNLRSFWYSIQIWQFLSLKRKEREGWKNEKLVVR